MKKMLQLFSLVRNLVRYYPLSCLFVAAIWVACFMYVPKTPLDNVPLMDKWTHLAMYGSTCAIIFIENLRRRKRDSMGHVQECTTLGGGWRSLLLWSWLLPVLMSGLIEILQATCTGGRRSGDWLDFVANTIGATLGVAIGILLARCLAIGRKG